MPCRDYEDRPEVRAQAEVSDLRTAKYVLEERCDNLTALLCKATSKLAECEILDEDYELESWYKEHRLADLENMEDLLENLDIRSLTKDQFDKLDALLTEITEE